MTLPVGAFVRIFLFGAITIPALFANNSVSRALRAAEVLDQVMATPEKSIPQELLSRSQCIAILPGVKKGGLVVGARYGKGFMSCRSEDQFGWTAPSAIRASPCSPGSRVKRCAVRSTTIA